MNYSHLVAAIVACVIFLSSCKKEDIPVTTVPAELKAFNAEDLTEIPTEEPAALEAKDPAGHSYPPRTLPSGSPTPAILVLGAHTPTEAQFVKGEALDVSRIGQAFQGNWAETVQQLRGDSVADQDANELLRAYEKHINATLTDFDGLKLKEFACGITLCAGTIVSSDRNAYAQWHKRMLSMNRLPVFSYVDMPVKTPNSTEHRFAFSSDQTAPGLSGRF